MSIEKNIEELSFWELNDHMDELQDYQKELKSHRIVDSREFHKVREMWYEALALLVIMAEEDAEN